MNFIGTGKRLAQGDVGNAARVLGVETAVLLAFMEVEAAGRGFDNQNRPKMLFEPHVFWRNLSGVLRTTAVTAGLAYAKWKSGNYPSDSYPRLNRATAIAREPALRSASYGLPQILGENAKAAGFTSAEQMVRAMMQGEREQLLAMVTLLQDWGLGAVLRGRDFTKSDSWRDGVRRYNGPAYERHNYHGRAAVAYVKHSKNIDAATGAPLPPKVVVPDGVTALWLGMRGEAVRNLQADLQSLGYVFKFGIDGRFGDETDDHVRAFQKSAGLTVDGKAGTATRDALDKALVAATADKSPSPPEWQRAAGIGALVAAIIGGIAAFLSRKD